MRAKATIRTVGENPPTGKMVEATKNDAVQEEVNLIQLRDTPVQEFSDKALWNRVQQNPAGLVARVVPARLCSRVVRSHSTQVYPAEGTCLVTVKEQNLLEFLSAQLPVGAFLSKQSTVRKTIFFVEVGPAWLRRESVCLFW